MPCSKSDVFQSSVISLIEKRFLMKFLEVVQQPIPPPEWTEKTFLQVLEEYRLEGLLRAVIVHAICGVDSAQGLSATAGAALVKKYLGSVGRFGPSPFLCSLYGGSEAAQAFSRLAAVHGGTYMLRKGVRSVRTEEGSSVLVVDDTEGETWRAKRLVLSPGSCTELAERCGPILHRACVAVKQSSALGAATVTHVVGGRTVHALHVDSTMKIAPDGLALVYLWAEAPEPLAAVLEKFGECEWKIEWTTQARLGRPPLEQALVTHDPDQLELDFEACVREAQLLFEKIAPEGSKFF